MASGTPNLAHAPDHAPHITLEQWAALPEDQPGEVVAGRLVEEEVPDYVHELVISWFIGALRGWGKARGARVAGSGAKFAVAPRLGRMPDVTVYFASSAPPPARGLLFAPPDVAVEVVSATPRDVRRDRIEKLAEYAAFGVRWYWIVDPQLRTFEVLELGHDGRYVHALAADRGVVAEVPGCAGMSVDLDDLWAEVDSLA